jgi:hypothetical protein
MPTDTPFPAGTQEVVQVSFIAAVVTNDVSVAVTFGDQPIVRQLSDALGNTLAATFTGGAVSLAAAEYEGDVAPRPGGDRAVTVTDWVLAGRFVARLDYPTNAGEFQRADCAPRSNLGDGSLKVTDWVQAGRYAAGLDPLEVVGGPGDDSGGRVSLMKLGVVSGKASASRQVQITDAILLQGQTNTVCVNLEAQGDENALGFSLTFSPAVLEHIGTSLGTAAIGATLNVNTAQVGVGKLGVVLAMPTGTTFAAGTREVVKISLRTLSSETTNCAVAFSDQPVPCEVSDTEAIALAAIYDNGAVMVNPVPSLSLLQSGQGAALSWPLWATNFVLQAAEGGLQPLGTWTNFAVPTDMSSNECRVIVPISGRAMFYRLHRP